VTIAVESFCLGSRATPASRAATKAAMMAYPGPPESLKNVDRYAARPSTTTAIER
jgi:hypothetical protein